MTKISKDQRKDDFVTNSDDVACKTPKVDHTLKKLEDKGTEFLSMNSVDRKKQEAKEEGQAAIKNVDMTSNKPYHPEDLTVVLKEPCGYRKTVTLFKWFRKKNPLLKLPRVDFIFGD